MVFNQIFKGSNHLEIFSLDYLLHGNSEGDFIKNDTIFRWHNIWIINICYVNKNQ